MKAVVLYEHGEQEQLIYETNYRDPEIGPGDVLVRVKATSLNYHDVFTRRGMPGITLNLPVIPGLDVAGEVAEIGPEVKADPQVEALGGMLTVDQPGVGEIELAHQALWFDGKRAEAEGPAPRLGEHGREVLTEAGLDSASIDALKSSGALIEN